MDPDNSDRLRKEIEDFGGVVLLQDIPNKFPFTSDEMFEQISKGNVLRFDGPNFQWKKSPFELKGYVGNLGTITRKVYQVGSDPIDEILKGKTIDIDVYEVRPNKSKRSKSIRKVESHLRVLHQRNSEGNTIGKYNVIFRFNNGNASEVSVTYEDGVKTCYSFSAGRDEPELSCTCFGKTKTTKDIGGILINKPVPELFVVENTEK